MSTLKKYEIIDGPSVYGIVDSFLACHDGNTSSSHTFHLVLVSDGTRSTMKIRREFRIKSMKHESGGTVASLLIEGVLDEMPGSVEFKGYYHTGGRKGHLEEVMPAS